MSELKIASVAAKNGNVELHLTDGQVVKLNTMDAASLLNLVGSLAKEAGMQLPAESATAPSVDHIQLEETAESLFFRVFVSPRVHHEYRLDRDTTLAEDMMELWKAIERRHAQRQTH